MPLFALVCPDLEKHDTQSLTAPASLEMLKKCVIENVFSVAMIAVAEFFLFTSAKSLHSGRCRWAEEPH